MASSRRRGRPIAARVVGVLVFALLVTGFATARGGDPALYPARAGDGVTIYLVDNGTHTDLAIPRAALIGHGGPSGAAAARIGDAAWVLVGWGDGRFYEGEGPLAARLGDGLRALFVPHHDTVVHLEGFDRRPDLAWRGGVHALTLSRAGLAALLARLDRSFVTGPDGAPIRDPIARPSGEGFFRSAEPFGLFHLCNHWTAELLNAAGLPVTPVLDTLPAGLRLDLRLRAGA